MASNHFQAISAKESKMRARTQGAIPVEKLLLTIDEAAQVLSLGRSAVYELVMRKRLPSVTFGRSRRIAYADLKRFVEQQSYIQQ